MFGAVECFGGQICLELTAEVTHFICNDANTSEIYKQATASTTGVTKTTTPSLVAILPHWLDDCFKTQRLLDVDNYAFPDPPLLLLTPEDLLRKRLEMKKKKSGTSLLITY